MGRNGITHKSLKAWRKAKGWDQRQAAAYLGISQSRYSHYENGLRPRSSLLVDLTQKTGVPIEVLIGAA